MARRTFLRSAELRLNDPPGSIEDKCSILPGQRHDHL
jgi:hypothetical protein